MARVCLLFFVLDFLVPPCCSFAAAFVVDEEVSQGVYRVVVQAVLEWQFDGS